MTADLPPSLASTEQLTVELVAADQSLVAGTRQWLALKFTHAPHWHTYWVNPGDSGLPTKTRWSLPAGTGIGTLKFPSPARHALGELINFGYGDELILPVELKLDPALPAGLLKLAVDVAWLVCREECIPGKARLGLELPVLTAGASAAPSPQQAAILATVSGLPSERPWPLQVRESGDRIELRITDGGALDPAELEIYPVQPQVLATAAPEIRRDGDSLVVSAARSDYFTGIPDGFSALLVQREGRQGHLVRSSGR